jgi:hypothetical protein
MDPHRRSNSLTFTLTGIGLEQRENEAFLPNYDVEHGAFVEDPEDIDEGNSSRRSSGERITRYHERPLSKSIDR